MLVKSNKHFNMGAAFATTFLGVLLLIFSPVFMGKNGLQFADDSFNKLAKGSSYFIPKVWKTTERHSGKEVSFSVELATSEDAERTSRLFAGVGAKAQANGPELAVTGDLGAILQSALRDADAMYKNDGATVSSRYGYDEKAALKDWWAALTGLEKSLKKDKLVAEARTVSDVVKKAIEPGYNFYGIDGQKVADHAGMMSGLLIFYVAYTMWWGYAIFYLFEGLGLGMKKVKIRKEA